jgi:hypothetical protein
MVQWLTMSREARVRRDVSRVIYWPSLSCL